MSMTLMILVGEFFLITLIFVAGLGIVAWQRKKRLGKALNLLTANLEKVRPERREKFLTRLTKDSGLDEQRAAEIATEFLQAENAFFVQFFATQLKEDVKAIATLGGSLHELMDQYLDLLPMNYTSGATENASQKESETLAVQNDASVDRSGEADLEVLGAGVEDETTKTSSEEEEKIETDKIDQTEPEIYEKQDDDDESSLDEAVKALDEVAQSASNAESEKPTANNEAPGPADVEQPVPEKALLETENEAEPSWDEAFAEIDTESSKHEKVSVAEK